MKSLLFIFIFFILNLNILSANNIEEGNSNTWLKTYKNYKNYNSIISNITKINGKLQNPKIDQKTEEELLKKLSLNKSKLYLYETNNSFDTLLLKYKMNLPEISLVEFIFENKLNEINRTIKKYQKDKNLFYSAKSILQNKYESLLSSNSKDSKISSLKNDIYYFNEYSENIEKTHQNLLELRIELEKKYEEYKNEVFIKHLYTLLFIFILYVLYRILSYVFISYLNEIDVERNKNYSKLLSLLFVTTIFIFIVMRYIDDLIYIITFLGVVAAALTIAMREVLLNIAGAIYIFFTSILKVGDRIMVQFDTKHTIGDIVSISLIKIKLNEIDDYANIKDVKNVGRTIYIPNSYIFTKVFYNYSVKKNGIVNDILEFEFDINNDFEFIEQTISKVLKDYNLSHKTTFGLNSTKSAILCTISYEVNFKQASRIRGLISICLLTELKENKNIHLKSTKSSPKLKEDDGE